MTGSKSTITASSKYVFKGEIGKGKFGVVYLAEDRITGKQFAVKKIPQPKKGLFGTSASADFITSETELQKEARISSLLSQGSEESKREPMFPANVVSVHEVLEDKRHLYIVMDLCQGGTLADYLDQRRHGTVVNIGPPAVRSTGDIHRVFSATSLDSFSDAVSFGGSSASDASGAQSPHRVDSSDDLEDSSDEEKPASSVPAFRLHDERRRAERREREDEAAWIIWEIAAAVAHCHRRGVLHRDIKPENILLQRPPVFVDGGTSRKASMRRTTFLSAMLPRSFSHASLPRASVSAPSLSLPHSSPAHELAHSPAGQQVVLADFGLAEQLSEDRPYASRGLVGSPAYLAPEVAAGLPVGFASDVWGIGICLYFILSEGQLPFSGRDTRTLLRSIRRASLPMSSATWALTSEDAKTVVRTLLAASPKQRPMAEEVMKMAWVAEGHARWIARHGVVAE